MVLHLFCFLINVLQIDMSTSVPGGRDQGLGVGVLQLQTQTSGLSGPAFILCQETQVREDSLIGADTSPDVCNRN